MWKWFQRLRGALGTGITWAVAWAPIGAITGWFAAMALGLPVAVVEVNYALVFGALGFVGGTVFAMLLAAAEGRRSFAELSLPRFAACGAGGGMVLGAFAVGISLLGAGLTVLGATVTAACTLLGAASAATTLTIARAGQRAPAHPSPATVARAGLSTAHAAPLLGKGR